jgi:hypothetical protein
MIKTLSAPFRMALRFPLVQFALVIALIMLLQSAGDSSVFGRIFSGLDALVDHRWSYSDCIHSKIIYEILADVSDLPIPIISPGYSDLISPRIPR